MKLEVLSKSKIKDDFLRGIIVQIQKDLNKSWSSEELEILNKIIADFEWRINKGSFRDGLEHFVLQENEYNFLEQNDKLLWCDCFTNGIGR